MSTRDIMKSFHIKKSSGLKNAIKLALIDHPKGKRGRKRGSYLTKVATSNKIDSIKEFLNQ